MEYQNSKHVSGKASAAAKRIVDALTGLGFRISAADGPGARRIARKRWRMNCVGLRHDLRGQRCRPRKKHAHGKRGHGPRNCS